MQDFGGLAQIVATAGITFAPFTHGYTAFRLQHSSDAGLYGSDALGVDMYLVEIGYKFLILRPFIQVWGLTSEQPTTNGVIRNYTILGSSLGHLNRNLQYEMQRQHYPSGARIRRKKLAV